jgi:hypothetical protein
MAVITIQQTKYMFVDCPDPQHVKLQRKKGSKSNVRSHVVKEFHRRIRIERQQSFQQTSRPVVASPPTSAAVDRDEDHVRTKAGQDALKNEQSKKEEDSAMILRRIGTEFIWSMVSQSRCDPFDCLPSANLPKYMQRVLDHGETVIIPFPMIRKADRDQPSCIPGQQPYRPGAGL